MNQTYYAIGDIHGEFDKLSVLMASMIEDSTKHNNKSTFVFLGDYVDRGKKSREVVQYIREFQQDCKLSGISTKVIALMGNHEDMMYNACRFSNRNDVYIWHINGGEETLQSYGANHPKEIFENWPQCQDVDWIGSLPYYFKDEENKIIFVHAGILPREFPEINKETAIWTRAVEFFTLSFWTPEMKDYLVVHGHTPTQTTYVSNNRVGLDTGACFPDYGNLSAARIDTNPRKVTKIFQVNNNLNVNIYPC